MSYLVDIRGKANLAFQLEQYFGAPLKHVHNNAVNVFYNRVSIGVPKLFRDHCLAKADQQTRRMMRFLRQPISYIKAIL